MSKSPETLRKTITKQIGGAASVGKFIYKVSLATGHIQFFHKTDYLKQILGQELLSHHVEVSESEKRHLLAGGTIVVAHGCGAELHVRVPKIT